LLLHFSRTSVPILPVVSTGHFVGEARAFGFLATNIGENRPMPPRVAAEAPTTEQIMNYVK
jgi:hypothetical protein